MTTPENHSTQQLDEGFTQTWRYKLGLFLIVAGHLLLLGGLALPFVGVNAGIVGAVVLGGEVIALSSIVFLGKKGFKAIKAKIFGSVKASYTAPVGRARHSLGIALFLTNVLTTYLIAAYAWDVFTKISSDNPIPRIWGLGLGQQDVLVQVLFFAGEISFLIAIYVLGAEWWGKFRNIFVWSESKS